MLNCKITGTPGAAPCELTVSGVKRMAIANWGDYTYTASGQDCLIDTIDLGTEKFYEVNFAEGSGYANSTVEQGGTADNKSLIHQVGFTLTSIDCDMISNWQSYLMGRLIFAVETKSGTVFIYGHKRGLRASQFDLNTGTAETDESGITALYEGKQASMPLVVKDWSIIEALYAPRPVNSISFDNDNYNITTTEGTAGEVGFRVFDNNGNDITDLCEITISGDYVSVEGDEFVVGDDVAQGRYQTIATVTYEGKTATTTIYVDVEEPDYSTLYLTFEALESGTFSCSKTVDYSIDGGQNWTTLEANTQSPTINTGNKIIWKNTQSGNKVFYATGNFNAIGNVMSMVYGDNFQNQTTFPGGFTLSVLFKNNTKLISAGNLILPVTEFDTTGQMAYYEMFRGCTALTTAPSILPATTLNTNCYNSMFRDCTALTTAPVLPATTLASGCYWNMFYGCTTLTTAPTLPATRLIDSQGVLPMSCYKGIFNGCTNLNRIKAMFIDDPSPYNYSCTEDWVNGVAATGTFIKNADAQWSVTGVNGIPENWTVIAER